MYKNITNFTQIGARKLYVPYKTFQNKFISNYHWSEKNISYTSIISLPISLTPSTNGMIALQHHHHSTFIIQYKENCTIITLCWCLLHGGNSPLFELTSRSAICFVHIHYHGNSFNCRHRCNYEESRRRGSHLSWNSWCIRGIVSQLPESHSITYSGDFNWSRWPHHHDSFDMSDAERYICGWHFGRDAETG